MDKSAGIVWSTVSKEDLAEMEATAKETSGILDELISTIPNADIHVLFTELEDGAGFKASARSSAAVDFLQVRYLVEVGIAEQQDSVCLGLITSNSRFWTQYRS